MKVRGGGACGPLDFDNSLNRNTGLNVDEIEKRHS